MAEPLESSAPGEDPPPQPGLVVVPPALEEIQARRLRKLRRPLPLWVRILVLLAGWIVVLVGIAGLVLPGPGMVTIVIGAAILSVASELAYEWMRKSLSRWPKIWDRVEAFRDRILDKLHEMLPRRK